MKNTFLFILLIGSLNMLAAPFNGNIMQFLQPDGTSVDVRLYGTEFYMRAEGLDGFTLMRDKTSGWICYANLSADGAALVSTGVHYTGKKDNTWGPNADMGIPRHIDISEKVRNQIIDRNKRNLLGNAFNKMDKTNPYAVSGNIKGLCIVVDFSDEVGTLPLEEFDDFCNDLNYTNFGNNGSLRKYYSDISGGLVDYENVVYGYYRAPQTFAFYENLQMGVGAQQILGLTLNWIESLGFDFSTLSTNPDGSIMAINLMYTGVAQTWSEGMWWHQGYYQGFSADGVQSGAYNCSPAYSPLSIGTVCHENGHMLGRWPDTYKYNNNTGPDGIGAFDLMCWYGDEYNPVPPNPHFWSNAGWGEVADITFFNGVNSDTANTLTCCKYRNMNDTNEFFLLENRVQSGRSISIPDEGLTIWHIDRDGSNQTTHHEVFLEHAGNNIQDHTNACFHAGFNDEFSESSLPGSNFYNGDPSGLRVWEISNQADVMSYKLGVGEPAPAYFLSYKGVSGDDTGDGFLEAGESGNISIDAANFGQLISDSVTITLTSSGPNADMITVYTPELIIDTMFISVEVSIAYNVTISGEAQVGDEIQLKFQIDDGTYSAYITNTIIIGKQVIIGNEEVTICSGIFFDSGAGSANYSDHENFSATFYPAMEDQRIKAEFTAFALEDETLCAYDYLRIYDGPTATSVRIGTFCGINSPGTIISSHSTGALTFVFHSDEYVTDIGWSAIMSCTEGVGLTDISNEADFRIYPNPLTDKAEIGFNLSTGKQIEIVIIDIYGTTVKKYYNPDQTGIELKRESFNSGVYFVQLWEGARILRTEKLIVL